MNAPSLQDYRSAKPHPDRREGGRRLHGVEARQGDGPTVSVVTVVLDAGEALESTLRSVSSQDYPAVEHILVDGGSTDGTLEVIEAHDDRLAYWLSEPDGGLYDAMNKGIAAATGDLVGLLNAGDVYTPGALTRVARAYQRLDPKPIVYGDMWMLFPETGLELYFRAELSRLHYTCTIPHPSVFVPREIYEQSGLYSLRYSLASDYVFMASQLFRGRRFYYLEEALSVFRDGGLSTRLGGYLRSQAEVVAFHWSSRSGHAVRAGCYAAFHVLVRCLAVAVKSLLGKRLSTAIGSWRLRRRGARRARPATAPGTLPTPAGR